MLSKSRRASESRASDSESTLLPTSILTTSQYWRRSTPQALSQEIARRLAQPGAKEEVAKAILNERLEFKALWNRSLPINQLPYELLVYIFNFLHPPVTIGLCGEPTSSREISQPTLKLMATCRFWRDVIVNTPAFWSAIVPECWNAKWAELCLARSHKAPIEVWVQLLSDRSGFTCPSYSPAHRIRHLYFYFAVHPPLPDVDNSGKDWLLRLLFGTEVPAMRALENLEVKITYYGQPETLRGNIPNDVNFTRQHLPCLRSLILAGVQAPQDAALYAGLHTLSLTSCSHNLSIDQFLDALALCTRLKILRLRDTLDCFSDDWKERDPVPRQPLMYFPHLDSLEVSQHGCVCTSKFLAHIHVPAPAQLEIWARDNTRVPGHRDVGASIFFLAGGLLQPSHATTLAPLSTVTDVRVDSRRNVYSDSFLAELRVYRSAGTAATATTVTARMTMNTVQEDAGARRGWVRELVELLGRAPVTTLTLDNSCNPPDSVEDWAAVFRAFPRLERLSVEASAGPGMDNMLFGLHVASVSATATATRTGTGTPAVVVCPHLRNVTVSGLATTTVYEAIRTCIVYRGRQGVVLEELNLDLARRSGDFSAAPIDACVRDIEKFVGLVKWHGVPSSSEIDPPVMSSSRYVLLEEDPRGVGARFKSALRRLGDKFSRHFKVNRRATEM